MYFYSFWQDLFTNICLLYVFFLICGCFNNVIMQLCRKYFKCYFCVYSQSMYVLSGVSGGDCEFPEYNPVKRWLFCKKHRNCVSLSSRCSKFIMEKLPF